MEKPDKTLHESWGGGLDGYPLGFEIKWSYCEAYAYFHVYERIGRYANGTFTYRKQRHASSDDTIDTLDGAHPYMKGGVAWDREYQAEFDYMHWSGRDGALQHGELIVHVHDRAMALMGTCEDKNEE